MGFFLYFSPMNFEKAKEIYFIFPDFFINKVHILNEKESGLGSKIITVSMFFIISIFLGVIIDLIMILRYSPTLPPEDRNKFFNIILKYSIFALFFVSLLLSNLENTSIRRSSPIAAISFAARLTSIMMTLWTFYIVTRFFVRHTNDSP